MANSRASIVRAPRLVAHSSLPTDEVDGHLSFYQRLLLTLVVTQSQLGML